MALVLVGPLNTFVVGGPPVDVTGPFQHTNPNATARMLCRFPNSPQGVPQLFCLSSTCTHQWCDLVAVGDRRPNSMILTCGCHQSEFNLVTGAVVHDPAVNPLTQFAVQVTGGNVFVDADPLPLLA